MPDVSQYSWLLKALKVAAVLGGSAVAICPLTSLAQTPIFTVETVSPFQEVLRRGNTLTLKYKFSVNGSTSTAYKVFVHVIDATNTIRLQDDHFPPTPTTAWSNVNVSPIPDVSYSRSMTIPGNFPLGDYRIVVGLYNTTTGSRLTLSPGNYVAELSAGTKGYVASFLTVTSRTIRNDIFSAETTWPVVTAALNADLAAIVSGTATTPGEIYKLPKGGCRYSTNPVVASKTNIDIVGAGVMDTTLAASDKDLSALQITTGHKVRVRDFSLRTYPGPVVYPCSDTQNRNAQRSTLPTSAGILIDRGSEITVERTRVGPVFSSGVFFAAVNGGAARANEIYDTLADGIHVSTSINSSNTTPSSNIVVEGNIARNTGDDSFSSVGYVINGVPVVMQGTQIKSNRSFDGCTSGVTIEGTSGAVVMGNEVTRSGMAGIRVASNADWQSPATTSASISGNTLDSVRMSCQGDHPALLVYSTFQAVSGVSVSGNTIKNPRSAYGIRAVAASPGTVSGVTATDNSFIVNLQQPACSNGSTANLPQAACVVMEPSVVNPTVSGNTYNGAACP